MSGPSHSILPYNNLADHSRVNLTKKRLNSPTALKVCVKVCPSASSPELNLLPTPRIVRVGAKCYYASHCLHLPGYRIRHFDLNRIRFKCLITQILCIADNGDNYAWKRTYLHRLCIVHLLEVNEFAKLCPLNMNPFRIKMTLAIVLGPEGLILI
jgi:hypothetical protein